MMKKYKGCAYYALRKQVKAERCGLPDAFADAPLRPLLALFTRDLRWELRERDRNQGTILKFAGDGTPLCDTK